MENFSEFDTSDEPIELPPGFRFHPTDEELITHYLSHKVKDDAFSTKAIGDVDLNRVEPWDLPWKAKMGENEWYFFCVRDRKYPTGLRTNRATGAGYWKATGKDREIFRAHKFLVGMKKTLVFYKGRAPRGEKTNWVMHEFRLEGKHSLHHNNKNEWVICRIFKKGSGGITVHNCGVESRDVSGLPSLMDLSCNEDRTLAAFAPERQSHVTCFSNPTVGPTRDVSIEDPATWRSCVFSPIPSLFNKDYDPNDKARFSDYLNIQEVGFMPREEDEFTNNAYGSVDLDCLWN